MKKFLLTTLVAIIATMPMRVYAQNYTELVVQLLQTNPEYYKLPQDLGEELKPAFAEINKKILADPSLSDGLIQKYSETNLVSDFVEVAFVPSLKESVTEKELKDYITLMNSVDGRLYQLHTNQANEKMSMGMLEVIMPILTGLMEKGPDVNIKEYLKPVERKESIPADYVSAFNKFYGNGTLIETALNKIDLSKFKELNKDSKGTPIFEALISHLKSNMSTIMLNSYYGSVTEKDLEFGAKVLSNPTCTKLTEKLMDTVMKLRNGENSDKFGENFVMKYFTWLQAQGVKFKAQ